MKSRFLSLAVVVALSVMALSFGGCASSAKKSETLTADDSVAIAKAVNAKLDSIKKVSAEEPALPQNIDAAHESFIRAQEMELRGERALANVFWQHAAESDPNSRYLAFKLAEIMAAQGADSVALLQAQRANRLKGRPTASQLGLLAHLYVKDGRADSARKYFNAALDTSRYQDMTLLYDYSLFLEAVQDGKELVRIYDLLLPQVNYMPTLFQRQLKLLLDQHKDSAVVELFAKGHEATGDKKMLLQMVQGLVFQKRLKEVRAVVDTLTESTPEDESMVVLLMSSLAETNRDSAYAMLRKKYLDDGVRTPILANFLGHYEHLFGNLDSAKVHLKYAAENIVDQRVYVTGAYHTLSAIAFKENKPKDAVRYAEKADSVALGGDKAQLALTYGTAGMYGKAYKMLDSLIAVWDKWTPMEGIADSASMKRMAYDVERNRRQFRSVYARILCVEAQEIWQKDIGDSARVKKSLALRERADVFYRELAAKDSADLGIRVLMAMNLERMERYDEAFAMFEYILGFAEPQVDVAEVLNYYGYTLIDLNRTPEELDKGITLVEKALLQSAKYKDSEPSEAYVDSWAWGLYRKGKFAEALETMKQIKSPRFDEDFVYWEHMAAIQDALGMTAEAKASYKKLKKLQPHHPAVKKYFKK
ncbi:Tetratricopeptide repeat-containing protein [Fibrobacter sp. UWH4]|nr:Tetratricopeptide repeat-containing protein [Fibrobacter sp. UWH4]